MVYDVSDLADLYIRICGVEEQIDKLDREFRGKLTRLENEINGDKQL